MWDAIAARESINGAFSRGGDAPGPFRSVCHLPFEVWALGQRKDEIINLPVKIIFWQPLRCLAKD